MSTLGLPAGKAGLPRSLRKHVRTEKARIRREVFVAQEQEKQIAELYQKIVKQTQKKQAKVEPKKEAVLASK